MSNEYRATVEQKLDEVFKGATSSNFFEIKVREVIYMEVLQKFDPNQT